MENKKPKYTFIERETLRDIADSIRSGKGTTKEEMPLSPTKFDEEILTLTDGFRGVVDRSATDIVIPYGATKISANLFREAYFISSITVPNSVTLIENNAFHDCRLLREVRMSENLAEIKNYAFANCYLLTEIKIPKGVTKIGNSAFYDCKSCKTYDFTDHTSPPDLGSNAFTLATGTIDRKIYVPDANYLAWSTAPNWTFWADEGLLVGVSNFYINGDLCKTIPGMTWQEWIDSRWNTIGATNHDGVVYVNEKPLYIIGAGYTESYVDSSLILVTDMVQDMAYNNSSTYAAFKLCGKWTFGLAGKTLEEWIASPFNNLGAQIQEVDGQYRVYLSDQTYGIWYDTRGAIANETLTDGLVIEEAKK